MSNDILRLVRRRVIGDPTASIEASASITVSKQEPSSRMCIQVTTLNDDLTERETVMVGISFSGTDGSKEQYIYDRYDLETILRLGAAMFKDDQEQNKRIGPR
jgi:hypothetical protein